MINKHKYFIKEYRPDINGLRAVAVLLVLLYHLEYKLFPAGFLGVDVFLVISGYLISRNILNDLENNKFSFKDFYVRRIKRLFPALFFTIALSLFVGFYLLSPVNLERLGKSALSGVLSVANIFLFNEKGYFDLESEFKPLLHIWSLSLEEQFYLIWPMLLLGIFKFFRKKIFLVILLFILISLYINSIYLSSSPEAVFYLLPFRFFEFFLGAMCVWLCKYHLKNKILLEIILLSGLFLIFYSSIIFNKLTPMPGSLSLLPCCGTMLIIYAGQAKYSSWILKNKVFELIGKSSYSIYLIHWPLIVYYKYATLSELTNFNKIILGSTSLILGFLMWKYIENVFRHSNIKSAKFDKVWLWFPTVTVILSLIAINFWVNKGYSSRYPSEFNMTHEEILENRKRYWKDNSNPDILKGSNEKTIIVMGNSASLDLIYALRKNGLEAKIISLQTSFRCYNFGTPVKEEFTQECESKKKKNLENVNWPYVDAIYLHDSWPRNDLNDLRDFLKEIRSISKAPIYVFGPKMVFKSRIPDIVHSCKSFRPEAINKYAQDFIELENRSGINSWLIKLFQKEEFAENNIFYVNLLGIQGNGENRFDIISTKTSDFLYFDKSHLTNQGALELGEKLKSINPHLFNLSDSNN